MQEYVYRETQERGTAEFPLEYHFVDENHPRYEMMYHWHSEYEIIYIIKGEINLILDGNECLAKAGDVVFVGDRVCHGGHPSECEYVCLVFDLHAFNSGNNLITKHIDKLLNHEIRIQRLIPREQAQVTDIVKDMVGTVAEKKAGYEICVYGLLYQVIGAALSEGLYTARKNVGTKREGTSNHRGRILIKKVITYIEEHYTEPITLSELSGIANMSNKYFCTFFYNYTHRTPIDYVNHYRIECACEQLRNTDKSVIDIAYDTGFNDASYFTKAFKKYVGATPLNYRKSS